MLGSQKESPVKRRYPLRRRTTVSNADLCPSELYQTPPAYKRKRRIGTVKVEVTKPVSPDFHGQDTDEEKSSTSHGTASGEGDLALDRASDQKTRSVLLEHVIQSFRDWQPEETFRKEVLLPELESEDLSDFGPQDFPMDSTETNLSDLIKIDNLDGYSLPGGTLIRSLRTVANAAENSLENQPPFLSSVFLLPSREIACRKAMTWDDKSIPESMQISSAVKVGLMPPVLSVGTQILQEIDPSGLLSKINSAMTRDHISIFPILVDNESSAVAPDELLKDLHIRCFEQEDSLLEDPIQQKLAQFTSRMNEILFDLS